MKLPGHRSEETANTSRIIIEAIEHQGLWFWANARAVIEGYGVTVIVGRKERGFCESLPSTCCVERDQLSIIGPALQPKSPMLNEIHGGCGITLPKQELARAQ